MNVKILPDTKPLETHEDLSQKMVAGLHDYFDRLTLAVALCRRQDWKRNLTSPEPYTRSVQPNRERFAERIGLSDPRLPADMYQLTRVGQPGCVAKTSQYSIQQVAWPVVAGLCAEGLLLTPNDLTLGRVVAIPDANQTPEQIAGLAAGIAPCSQFASRLAENGFQVLVPSLISRDSRLSQIAEFGQTNQSHREWLYRQAFEMGRHIIGYDVQGVLAGVDWFKNQDALAKVGVMGYGEGGLVAFYAAAVDERIQAAVVSGYFGPREELWREPIDRNVWGLLTEFGDAEIATLIAPRSLIIEYSCEPIVNYSPPLDQYGDKGITAAPGVLTTPDFQKVQAEFERIEALIGARLQSRYIFSSPDEKPVPFGSFVALRQFAQEMQTPCAMNLSENFPQDLRQGFDPKQREERQFKQIERLLQEKVQASDEVRQHFFGDQVNLSSLEEYSRTTRPLRKRMWEVLIGRLPEPDAEMSPQTRLIYEREKWLGYEVVLDVWNGVFAWGILCIPRDLQPGEKRPVVVCQHGYEGLPKDTIEDTEDGLKYYRQFTAKLAERGFITFAPHNPYRGAYRYKQLQRKANPLGVSLGSVLIAQHTQILRWLGNLPFVDRGRVAFYGLSYGGWTALRIPPILEGYCLAICSANFNDWIRKVTSVQFANSYMGDASFEMCEWNAGNTFSHAEMASLIAPRPFMVERGMQDIVAPDHWVAGEYAKVRRLFTQLDIPDRTEIEIFNGEHCIHGQGTFKFLHKQLNWPEPNIRG